MKDLHFCIFCFRIVIIWINSRLLFLFLFLLLFISLSDFILQNFGSGGYNYMNYFIRSFSFYIFSNTNKQTMDDKYHIQTLLVIPILMPIISYDDD